MRLFQSAFLGLFLIFCLVSVSQARGIDRDTYHVIRAQGPQGQHLLLWAPGSSYVYVAGKTDVSLQSGESAKSYHLPIPNTNLPGLEGQFLSEYTESTGLTQLESLNYIVGDVNGDGYNELYVPTFGVIITGLSGEHGGAPQVHQVLTYFQWSYRLDAPEGEYLNGTTPLTSFNTATQQWEQADLIIRLTDTNGDGRADLVVRDTIKLDEDCVSSGWLWPCPTAEADLIGRTDGDGRFAFWFTGSQSPQRKPIIVGATAGEMGVEGGVFTYTVPIALPVGTAGVQPGLSLVYNSGSGNGPLGMGWSLSGASAISRCPKDWVHDGEVSNLSFNESDRLCFGGQRLVAVEGAYWATGTEYRTISESWVRVIQLLSPSGGVYFKALYKDGDIHYYGYTPRGNTETHSTIRLGNGKVNTWAQASTEDRHGNYILFHYEQEHSQLGFPLLEEVLYTGNDSKGLVPYNKVSMHYSKDERPDISSGYIAGGENRLSALLTSITSYSEDNIFRQYFFDYDNIFVVGEGGPSSVDNRAGVSRLIQLQECTASHCVPATKFQWTEQMRSDDIVLEETQVYSAFSEDEIGSNWPTFTWVDLNSDHRSDACYSKGRVKITFTVCPDGHEGDFEARVCTVQAYRRGRYTCQLGGEQGFASQEITVPGYTCPAGKVCENDSDIYRGTMQFIDVNGDGLQDAVWLSPSGIRYSLFDGTAFGASVLGSNGTITPTHMGIGAVQDAGELGATNRTSLRYADINGDSLVDVCYRHSTLGIRCFLNTLRNGQPGWDYNNPINSGICANDASNCDEDENWYSIQIVDVNADGRADIFYRSAEGVRVHLFNGVGFAQQPSWQSALCSEDDTTFRCTEQENFNSLQLVDLNADGLPEICYQSANRFRCLTGTGDEQASFGWISRGDGRIFRQDDQEHFLFFPVVPDETLDEDNLKEFFVFFEGDDLYKFSANYLFHDVNDDGLPDLLLKGSLSNTSPAEFFTYDVPEDYRAGEGINVFINQSDQDGTKFVFLAGSTICESCDAKARSSMTIVDHDGNGAPELLIRKEDGVHVVDIGARSSPNYIEAVTNGLGLKNGVEYALLNEPGLYTRGEDVSYPLYNMSGPMPVVKKLHGHSVATTGFPTDSTTEYQYSGLIGHGLGHGVLGYREITSIRQTGISELTAADHQYIIRKQITRYNLDYENHLAGTVASTDIYINDELVGHSETQYESVVLNAADQETGASSLWPAGQLPLAGHRYAVRTKASVSHAYAPESGLVKSEGNTVIHGPYGTLLESTDVQASNELSLTPEGQLSQATGNHYTTVTRNWYENDTDNWILARLTASQVERSGVDKHGNTLAPDLRTSAWTYHPEGEIESERVLDVPARLALAQHQNVSSLAGYKQLGPVTYHNRSTRPASRPDEAYVNFGVSNLTRVVNSRGDRERSSASYADPKGRFEVLSVDALGFETQSTFHPVLGVVTSRRGPNGLETRWEYDSFGRVTQQINHDGTHKFEHHYFCGGSSLEVSACAGAPGLPSYVIERRQDGTAPTWAVIDLFGRTVRTIHRSLEGRLVFADTHYDALGRAVKTSEPYFQGEAPQFTVTQYDALDRVTQVVHPNGLIRTVTYNGLSQTETVIFERTQTQTSYSDVAGRTYKVVDNANNETHFVFDVFGNQEITRGKSHDGPVSEIKIEYDRLGRKKLMHDPDKGTWAYEYNDFGELTLQTDASGIKTCNQYDTGGRLVLRYDNYQGTTGLSGCLAAGRGAEATRWIYDTAPRQGDRTWKGLLHKVVAHDGYEEETWYDYLGRPEHSDVVIDGHRYRTSLGYDEFSRPKVTRYPAHDESNRKEVHAEYNQYGYSVALKDASGNDYWRVLTTDARGNAISEQLGNGAISTQRAYRPSDGMLEGIVSSSALSGGNDLQDNEYSFDMMGNLTHRLVKPAAVDGQSAVHWREDFEYDHLNRLGLVRFRDIALGASESVSSFTYKGNGNIHTKQGQGTYTYGQELEDCAYKAGPHAVTTVAHPSGERRYCYDRVGNMLSGNGREIQWTWFNKPELITKGANRVEMHYTPSRNLYKRVDTKETASTTTILIGGSYERIVRPGGASEEKLYIGGVAILVRDQEGQDKTQYLLKDHLGSTDVVVDSLGNVVERMNFDAWGSRRSAFDASMLTPAQSVVMEALVSRGYTGHLQLDAVGLIHMGGRVYDPELGRFLSADPFVQDPDSIQSMNRYSYVLNNPLSYTDPSGFFFNKIGDALKKLWKAVYKVSKAMTMTVVRAGQAVFKAAGRVFAKNPVLGSLVTIAGCAVATAFCPLISGLVSSASAYATTGDWTMALAAGMDSVATSMVSSVVYGAIAGVEGSYTKIALHSLAGGVLSKAQGGKFIHGAITGAVSKSFAEGDVYNAAFSADGDVLQRTLMAGVVGGTVSAVTGGKFANGAITAGFAHLFNAESGEQGAQKEGGSFWDWLTEGDDPILTVKLERGLVSDLTKGGGDTADGYYVKFAYEVGVGPMKFEVGAKYVYEEGLDPTFKLKYSQDLAKYGKLKLGGSIDVVRGIEKSISTAADIGYEYISTQSRGAVYIQRYQDRQRAVLDNL